MEIKVAKGLADKYGVQLGKHADAVIKGINRKDGHCPCELFKTADNFCPCTSFLKTKECICGLFTDRRL